MAGRRRAQRLAPPISEKKRSRVSQRAIASSRTQTCENIKSLKFLHSASLVGFDLLLLYIGHSSYFRSY